MGAKVLILDKRINSFGGIFFAIDQYRASGFASLSDKTLGTKGDKHQVSIFQRYRKSYVRFC